MKVLLLLLFVLAGVFAQSTVYNCTAATSCTSCLNIQDQNGVEQCSWCVPPNNSTSSAFCSSDFWCTVDGETWTNEVVCPNDIGEAIGKIIGLVFGIIFGVACLSAILCGIIFCLFPAVFATVTACLCCGRSSHHHYHHIPESHHHHHVQNNAYMQPTYQQASYQPQYPSPPYSQQQQYPSPPPMNPQYQN